MSAQTEFELITLGTQSTFARLAKGGANPTIIEVPWSDLKEVWNNADFEDVDFCSGAVFGDNLVACLTTAGGQGGIVAVRDLSSGQWTFVSEASYVLAALPLDEGRLVVTLHFVHVPYLGSAEPGHQIRVSACDGIIDAWSDRSSRVEYEDVPALGESISSAWQPRFTVNPEKTGGVVLGLFYDPASDSVHAVDGLHFHGRVRVSQIRAKLTR